MCTAHRDIMYVCIEVIGAKGSSHQQLTGLYMFTLHVIDLCFFFFDRFFLRTWAISRGPSFYLNGIMLSKIRLCAN